MSAPFRFPRFFVTSPAPCPYLAGKTERKVFTELSGNTANELNDALGRIGFRRSQSVAYRPSCADSVSYTHLRAPETVLDIVCRLLLEQKHSPHSIYIPP